MGSVTLTDDRITDLEKRLEDEQNLRAEEGAIDRRRISKLEERVENLSNQFILATHRRNSPKKNLDLSINSFVKGVE